MNKVYKFILFFVLIHSILILYIIPYNHAVDSLNSKKEQLPLKNLRTANDFEYDEKLGTINDTKSIEIELTDLSWNITGIQLNFTG